MASERMDQDAWANLPACKDCHNFDCKCDEIGSVQTEESIAERNHKDRLAKAVPKDETPWKTKPDRIGPDGIKIQSPTRETATDVTSLREPWRN